MNPRWLSSFILLVLCGIFVWPIDRPADAKGNLDTVGLAPALERANGLLRLRALIVSRHGKVLFERAFRGPRLDVPVNVKSVSKSVIPH